MDLDSVTTGKKCQFLSKINYFMRKGGLDPDPLQNLKDQKHCDQSISSIYSFFHFKNLKKGKTTRSITFETVHSNWNPSSKETEKKIILERQYRSLYTKLRIYIHNFSIMKILTNGIIEVIKFVNYPSKELTSQSYIHIHL